MPPTHGCGERDDDGRGARRRGDGFPNPSGDPCRDLRGLIDRPLETDHGLQPPLVGEDA